jgi:RimK-like ATP-grasp domain
VILLWGLASESPLAAVANQLAGLGARVAFFDQRAVPDTSLRLRFGAGVDGHLTVDGLHLDLADVTAVYLRPYDSRQLGPVRAAGPGSALWRHALELDDALMSWCELSPALVVNRPAAMASNESKPYQSRLIAAAGLRVPETLVTNDPEQAEAFWAEHRDVIYKSCSGVRSVVRRFNPADRERLRNLRWCPTQFQRRIPGLDHRVHVVGDRVFACRIRSGADDYRYDGGTDIAACTLDSDLAERCRKLSHGLGLQVAGLDLRESPDGIWYCFEVNPSPGFSYFQARTGQPIDHAIAELLLAGAQAPATRAKVWSTGRQTLPLTDEESALGAVGGPGDGGVVGG